MSLPPATDQTGHRATTPLDAQRRTTVDARQIVNLYYTAWQQRAGDMSGVPLAEDFIFRGPVASFDDAAGYAAMARQAGAGVRSFHVRHQFFDGALVCSVVDWE